MKTYKVVYKLKGDTTPRVKYIPSFSPEEAETELKWIVKTCYDQTPIVLKITEIGHTGEAVLNEHTA